MSDQKEKRLKNLLYRMTMLMKEYELRQVDYEAGPLIDEAEQALEEPTASRPVASENLIGCH